MEIREVEKKTLKVRRYPPSVQASCVGRVDVGIDVEVLMLHASSVNGCRLCFQGFAGDSSFAGLSAQGQGPGGESA